MQTQNTKKQREYLQAKLRSNAPLKRRRGAIAFVVAGSMIMLMGFAALGVDYGVLTADVNRLQRGADAGALAGATKLKSTGNDVNDTAAAKNLAVQIAAQNNVAVDINQIVVSDNARQIRVPADYTRKLMFARVIGLNTANVGRAATARIKGFSPPQISPIAISETLHNQMKADFAAGLTPTKSYDELLVNNKRESFDQTRFMLLNLDPSGSKSPSQMRDQITGDGKERAILIYPGEDADSVEDVDRVNSSSQGKFYVEAMETLFSRAEASPWFDAPLNGNIDANVGTDYANLLAGTEPANHPRVLNIIVSPDTGPHNNYKAPVKTFAPVYIERVFSDSRGLHTVFRFLPSNYGVKGGSYLLE